MVLWPVPVSQFSLVIRGKRVEMLPEHVQQCRGREKVLNIRGGDSNHNQDLVTRGCSAPLLRILLGLNRGIRQYIIKGLHRAHTP